MDDLKVLPFCILKDCGPASNAILAKGITEFRELAATIKSWPYGFPDPKPTTIGECLELGYGTCSEKHAIVAACAIEQGLQVRKMIGIYPMDARLVPRLGDFLAELGVDAVPATHCFLTCGDYRVDLTEGNCNGKTGPIDRYWHIREVEPLPSELSQEIWYRMFVEEDLVRFMPAIRSMNARLWLDIWRHCSAVLKLSLSCHPSRSQIHQP